VTAATRPPLVAGNWKMQPSSAAAAVALADSVRELVAGAQVSVVVCPPTIWLSAVAAAHGPGALEPGEVALGAQAMHFADSGAFTGETSPLMLAGLVRCVIIGHSERRQFNGETDADVAAKVASAVAHGLVPIAAIGETAAERRSGQTLAVIDRQLRAAVSGLASLSGSGLVVAYEPVWAIGTGDAASPADAQAAAHQVRSILAELDPVAAQTVRILYGGSTTPQNAAAYFAEPDLDGALVGGASLDAGRFAAIVRAAAEQRG